MLNFKNLAERRRRKKAYDAVLAGKQAEFNTETKRAEKTWLFGIYSATTLYQLSDAIDGLIATNGGECTWHGKTDGSIVILTPDGAKEVSVIDSEDLNDGLQDEETQEG